MDRGCSLNDGQVEPMVSCVWTECSAHEVAHTNGNPPMASPHLMQNTAIADGIHGGTSCIGAGIRREAADATGSNL